MLKKNPFSKLQTENTAFYILILIIILLAYGLLIPWLGFYWDDWPFAWLLRFFGPSEFIEAFRPFRPFLGPIFTFTTTVLGWNPLTWQLFGLLIRYFLSLELWFVLRLLWPSQKWNLFWVVLLFTVFPGYQQQWVSLTHVNQEMIPLFFLLASFGTTAWVVRNQRYKNILTILALLLQALGLFTTEYFFGLEILRVFFLYVIFTETISVSKNVLRKVGLYWLPYLAVWTLNAAWVYSFHRSSVYHSYTLEIGSSQTFSLSAIGNEILSTISQSGFASWLNTFQIISRFDNTLAQITSWVVLLLFWAAIFIFMDLASRRVISPNLARNDLWGFQALLIGLIAILAGRIPSWAAGLPLKLEFDYDRFMISIMLGASLFIVGMATVALKEGRRKIVILSILIGLSTAYQFSVANTFRRDWDNQKSFYWQLAWRIPNLKRGTALLAYELPLKYVSDMQITAPINWMYAATIDNRELPYILLYLKSRINSPALPSLKPNVPIQMQYRTTNFTGLTSNSVVIFKNANGCLRVLDDLYGNSETVPGANYLLLDAIHLSDPTLILVDAPQPVLDETLFGSEPAHNWCYFYENAEIARQQGHWEKIVKLHNEAEKAGYGPSMPDENLPFIEAFAMVGQTENAFQLADRMVKTQKELCPAVDTLWNRVLQTSIPTVNSAKIIERLQQSSCGSPR